MNINDVIKTTKLKDGFGGDVTLIETSDGKCCVRKFYTNPEADINAEWDALVFLHDKGFNVPKPLCKDKNNIYMQYIESGNLWGVFEKADDDLRLILIEKFLSPINQKTKIVRIRSTYIGKPT